MTITSEELAIEMSRTYRELECLAIKKISALQLGEAWEGITQ